MVEASEFKIDSCLIFLEVNWVGGKDSEDFEGKRTPKT